MLRYAAKVFDGISIAEARHIQMKFAYVEIKAPAEEDRTPSAKIACGENPVVVCEDPAKAPPQNFGEIEVNELIAAVTLVANVVHLIIEKENTNLIIS
jgi:hypothetical protein